MISAPIPRVIYGLFDADGWCHYIGQTRNPEGRMRGHRCVRPHLLFERLETHPTGKEACEAETHWIALLRACKHPLTNIHTKGSADCSTDSQIDNPQIVSLGPDQTAFLNMGHYARHFGIPPNTAKCDFFGCSPEQPVKTRFGLFRVSFSIPPAKPRYSRTYS